MIKKISIFTLLILFFSNFANANPASFNEVAKEILENSNSSLSDNYQLKSKEYELQISSNYWLPTLYLDSNLYRTNDPAQNFVGNLYQRAVKTNDLSIPNLNSSQTNNFLKTAIGLNLNLYQGNASEENFQYQKNMALAKNYEAKQNKINQYFEVAKAYTAIVLLKQHQKKLQKIYAKINEILKTYNLNNQKNQIGYFGFLVLKTSHNLIENTLNANQSKEKMLYKILFELGYNQPFWQVVDGDLNFYLNNFFKIRDKKNDISFEASSAKSKVNAQINYKKIRQAKNLPTLDFYAENYAFKGVRQANNGYNFGLNLHWNFYDPINFDNEKIENANSTASNFDYLNKIQQEKIFITQNQAQIEIVENSLGNLEKNDEMLFQNIKITQELYRTGSVAVSVLCDVIINYLSNFTEYTNSQFKLIELYSNIGTKIQFNPDEFIK
ncbi:MAG: TolC family protein [Rickettsiales bacterium]